MGHLAEGMRMVFRDRRYWRHILVPWFWSAVIFISVVVIGYFALVPWIQGVIESRMGPNSESTGLLKSLVALAYVAIWFFLAGFVFITITSLTSSFLWDDLSQRIEEDITRVPGRKSTLPTGRIVVDSLSRGVFSILIAIASLFCGWVLPLVGPVILAGWLGLLDYTSSAFLRYDRTVGQQWPVAMKMKGWFGFLVGSGLLSLLPFVNLLLLPGLVAGGTVMAVRSGQLDHGRASSSPVA